MFSFPIKPTTSYFATTCMAINIAGLISLSIIQFNGYEFSLPFQILTLTASLSTVYIYAFLKNFCFQVIQEKKLNVSLSGLIIMHFFLWIFEVLNFAEVITYQTLSTSTGMIGLACFVLNILLIIRIFGLKKTSESKHLKIYALTVIVNIVVSMALPLWYKLSVTLEMELKTLWLVETAIKISEGATFIPLFILFSLPTSKETNSNAIDLEVV